MPSSHVLASCEGYGTLQKLSVNPSAWSNEHCLSQRKRHLSWRDEHCSSCCTLSLIRLYHDNIGRKCNRAAFHVFTKELALLQRGKKSLQIIASFFFSPLEVWVSFLQSLISQPALCVSVMRKCETRDACYRQWHIAEVSSLKWCMTSPSYINRLFISSRLTWLFVRNGSLWQ